MEKVRVAIIGYGFLGKWHAEKADLIKDSELIAIVDPSAESQKKALEKFPSVKIVSDINQVIDEIDAAIIVTPTSTHYKLVDQLLDQKKHVFCEKPLTSTSAESEKILLKTNNAKQIVQVGHSERFHEVWEKTEYFQQYLIAPYSIKISRYAPFKGRATDVDVVQDLMIHDLDIMRMLLTKEPLSVSSIGFKSLTDKWDHVESFFELPEDSHCSIIVGRHSVEEIRKVELTNRNGTFQIDLLKCRLAWTENEELKTLDYSKRDHLLIEQEEFYQSILHNSKTRVNASEGAKAVNLVEKVLDSLETGKKINVC